MNFYKKSENVLYQGEIDAQCKDLSAEKWLKILQQKSAEQGSALTWHQIKSDPSIDHRQVLAKLGPYASYERDLMPKSDLIVPKNPVIISYPKPQQEEPDSDQIEIEPSRTDEIQSKKLKSISIPKTGQLVNPMNEVIIVRIDSNRSEQIIRVEDIEIISKPDQLSEDEIGAMLMGITENFQIYTATIFSDRFVAEFNAYPSGSSVEICDSFEVVFRLATGSRETLMIILYLENDPEKQEYTFVVLDENGDNRMIEDVEYQVST